MVKEFFAQIGHEPLKPAADGRFMNTNHSGDLELALTIQKVSGEHKAILCRQGPQAEAHRIRQAAKFGRRWRTGSFSRGKIDIVERSLAPRAPVVIDMSLGKRRAQPTKKRPTARVGIQWRAPLTIEFPQSIKLRVKRISELMTDRRRSGDGNGGLRERRTIRVEEPLPGGIAAQHTGVSQSQFSKMERPKEGRSLCSIGTVAGCQAIVDLFPDRSKYAAELLAGKAALRPLSSEPKLLEETWLQRGNRCGLCRRLDGQHKIAGL